MDTSRSVLRFAKLFFAGTLLSRVSGACRDISMAFYFGSSPEIAAFMVAYRLANLFRRLLGEGNLQAGFTPHFVSLAKSDPKQASLFYRDASFSLFLVLIGTVFVSEVVLWGLAIFLKADWAEIIHLAMWMLPGLIFICLYAMNSAFLQCQKIYFSPAFAPVVFNLFWIISVLVLYQSSKADAIYLLALSVSFAFALQWLMTAIQVKKQLAMPAKEWFSPHFFSPHWKLLIKPLSLGVIGVSATQINSALDAIFARFAEASGPAYLWYAIRVEQIPLALFGIALGQALLPSLSRAMKDGDLAHYNHLLVNAIRHSAALLIPCTFGLFALAGSGLNLLYGHGGFSAADVESTKICLWGYGFGLLPSVFVLLLATGSFAKKSYSRPTFAALVSVLFNIALNILLVFVCHLGAFSIAFSTSIVSILNCLILSRGSFVFSSLWIYFLQLTLCGCAAMLCTLVCESFVFGGDELTRIFSLQLIHFVTLSAVFIAVFGSLAYCFRMKEFTEIFSTRIEKS